MSMSTSTQHSCLGCNPYHILTTQELGRIFGSWPCSGKLATFNMYGQLCALMACPRAGTSYIIKKNISPEIQHVTIKEWSKTSVAATPSSADIEPNTPVFVLLDEAAFPATVVLDNKPVSQTGMISVMLDGAFNSDPVRVHHSRVVRRPRNGRTAADPA